VSINIEFISLNMKFFLFERLLFQVQRNMPSHVGMHVQLEFWLFERQMSMCKSNRILFQWDTLWFVHNHFRIEIFQYLICLKFYRKTQNLSSKMPNKPKLSRRFTMFNCSKSCLRNKRPICRLLCLWKWNGLLFP